MTCHIVSGPPELTQESFDFRAFPPYASLFRMAGNGPLAKHGASMHAVPCPPRLKQPTRHVLLRSCDRSSLLVAARTQVGGELVGLGARRQALPLGVGCARAGLARVARGRRRVLHRLLRGALMPPRVALCLLQLGFFFLVLATAAFSDF